jgi:hypothetical protein
MQVDARVTRVVENNVDYRRTVRRFQITYGFEN